MSGARLCSVPQCNNVKTKTNSFHLFPKQDEVLRQKWLKALKMRYATASMKVCSDHFTPENFFFPEYNTLRKKLKKGSVPSRNIPTIAITERQSDFPISRAQSVRSRKRIQWKEKFNFVTSNSQNIVKGIDDSFSAAKNNHSEDLSLDEDDDESFTSSNEDSVSSENEPYLIWPRTQRRSKARKIFPLDRKVQTTQTSFDEEKTTASNFLVSSSHLNELTGITSFDLLDKIEESLKKVERNKKQSRIFDLTPRQRIILTFAKLRTNMTFSCLAILFTISRSAAYEYFCHTISTLRDVMSGLMRWPEKNEIMDNMPRCFVNHTSTRVILDCIEITIGKRNSSNFNIIDKHSRCKRREIIKYLIGATPSGMISFFSRAYDDRVTDDELLIESGIIERMTTNDSIVTNKYFQVEDELEAYGVRLVRPESLFTDNEQTYGEMQDILAMKIHVEKIFERLRIFKFLKSPVPRSLLSHVNSIITITCGLVNLTPMLASDEFL